METIISRSRLGGNHILTSGESSSVWYNIEEWSLSEAIIRGNATNHIRLIVENGNLTAYVNGELVLTTFLGGYRSGYIGFGCGPLEEPGAHCAFYNLDPLAPQGLTG